MQLGSVRHHTPQVHGLMEEIPPQLPPPKKNKHHLECKKKHLSICGKNYILYLSCWKSSKFTEPLPKYRINTNSSLINRESSFLRNSVSTERGSTKWPGPYQFVLVEARYNSTCKCKRKTVTPVTHVFSAHL